MAFFIQASESSEGSEQQRYLRIYTQLSQGYDECSDTPPNNSDGLLLHFLDKGCCSCVHFVPPLKSVMFLSVYTY